MKTAESRSVIRALNASPWIAGFRAVQCIRAGCSRWLTQRYLVSRKVGVSTQGQWYCSYSCFATLATERLTQLCSSTLTSPSRVSRRPLLLILISRGCLTYEKSKLAKAEQEKTSAELGDIVVQLGYTTERVVAAARSSQWDCPVLEACTPPITALPNHAHIPLILCHTHSMIPLHYVPASNTLLLGFKYGVEYAVLYSIEQMTGCRTKACLIASSDFELQMRYRIQQPQHNDLSFENFQEPSKMAHILCNYGSLLKAYDVAFGRCREYVWARMKTESGVSNILFSVA